jgi:hypothetical protein
VQTNDRLRLLSRLGRPDGEFEPVEEELASVPDTDQGWIELGGVLSRFITAGNSQSGLVMR